MFDSQSLHILLDFLWYHIYSLLTVFSIVSIIMVHNYGSAINLSIANKYVKEMSPILTK
jgi:hypothetical protein